MDTRAKKIAFAAICMILLMSLFPPWKYTFDSAAKAGGAIHSERPAGYGLLFLPPAPEHESSLYGIRIDFSRLFLQWLLVVAIVGLVLLWPKVFSARRKIKPLVRHKMTPKETADQWVKNVLDQARKEGKPSEKEQTR